jgi:hypothetical protein
MLQFLIVENKCRKTFSELNDFIVIAIPGFGKTDFPDFNNVISVPC